MALDVPVVNDGNVVDQPERSKVQPTLFPSLGPSGSHSGVLHRSLHHDPLRVVAAKGNFLELNNGQSIFDATGGAAVSCLGHGDERYVVSS